MGLQRKEKREKKPISISFRVSEETERRLKVLGDYCGRGMTYVIEELIDAEYERIKAKDPKELKKAEKDL